MFPFVKKEELSNFIFWGALKCSKRPLTFFTLTDGWLKKKSESFIKYYIKVTCALKWARKLPRKTETYESA